ncbi:DUF3861 family protein [Rhizobium leguminosarum]|nr:DUF3861 family protein [Rhizobium leguminosarum]
MIIKIAKRTNNYRISLEQLELASGKEISQEPSLISMMEFLELLSNMKETDPFDNVSQSVQFAIGLKMFSDVIDVQSLSEGINILVKKLRIFAPLFFYQLPRSFTP